MFFDQDGTLVDSLPGIRYAVEAAIQAPCPDLGRMIGPPIRSILRSLVPEVTDARLDRLEAAFRFAYDSEGWRMSRAYPGAVQTLAELARAARTLYLVTNKPRHITLPILEMLQIDRCFAAVLTRDSRQPAFESKGAMLSHLLSAHGLDAARCLMVGDALEDCEAAADAGMRAAVMLHGYGAHRVPAERAEWIRVRDFPELAALCLGDGG